LPFAHEGVLTHALSIYDGCISSDYSILYQRGIYPPETFAKHQKYGLTMLVTEDEGLKIYLENVIKQLGGEITFCHKRLTRCREVGPNLIAYAVQGGS
jgi:hypothetical protein